MAHAQGIQLERTNSDSQSGRGIEHCCIHDPIDFNFDLNLCSTVLGRSVAFLTFHEPVVKRQSLDSQTSEGFKAGIDPEAQEKAEPADAGVTGGTSPLPTGSEEKDTVRINPFDGDSDDSSYDLFDENALGAQTSPPSNLGDGSVQEGEETEGGQEEGGDESGASQNEEASGATAGDNKDANTDRLRVYESDDGTEGRNGQPEPATRELHWGEGEAEAEVGEAAGCTGYGFARKNGVGCAAADGEFGNLASTAALTPDSVGPLPFSSGSTAPRSRTGSSEPPPSPTPASSLPNSARVERKVSRIAGLLRRFSSGDTSDLAGAQLEPLEPLEIDSDDEYGA